VRKIRDNITIPAFITGKHDIKYTYNWYLPKEPNDENALFIFITNQYLKYYKNKH
jgi:hypothetical protein